MLNDKDKRQQYDRFGTDPDTRSVPSPQSRNYGFERFEGELSPEDIFNMFFQGMGGFDPSGFGPGSGVQFRSFRPRAAQQRYQQRPGNQAAMPWLLKLIQIAPLLILLFSSFLGPLLSVFQEDPPFSLSRTSFYNIGKTTRRKSVPYWMNRYSNVKYKSESKHKQIEKKVEQEVVYKLDCFNF